MLRKLGLASEAGPVHTGQLILVVAAGWGSRAAPLADDPAAADIQPKVTADCLQLSDQEVSHRSGV
jgi:hypothetical protein